MKKSFVRILTAALALALVLPLAFSCTDSDDGTGDKAQDIVINEEYVITRSSKASTGAINSAKSLRQAYKDSGIELSIKDDWVQDQSQIPEKEILVGDTERAESSSIKESMAEGETWKIAVSGKKVVIVALSDIALANAVDTFINEYVKKGEGVNIMSSFVLTGSADESNTEIEFLWKDGDESVIRGGSWGPRVYTMSDGRLIAGFETSGGIKTATSEDNAKTWKKDAAASFHQDLACANVNFYEFEDKLYLAYRATGQRENGFYTSLQVSVSENGGKSWAHHSTVAEYTEGSGNTRGVWEPYLGTLNGKLTCFYANDSSSVTHMQNIEYMVWNGSSWRERTVVCDGVSHNSRDGMPVWTQTKGGEYVLVIESSAMRDSGHPFVIQLVYSKDGKSWSRPVTVYTPTTNGSKAGAPGVVELPNGQIIISFQTDEDATKKGDGTSVMKTIISDGTNVKRLKASNFSKSDNVFGTPDGEGSVWTGIWSCDGWLYAAAGTKKGSSLKKINLF